MKELSEMKPAEMVAEFNAITGANPPSVKFSSREMAEKRLTKVRADFPEAAAAYVAPIVEPKVKPEKPVKEPKVQAFPVSNLKKLFKTKDGVEHCPKCGSTEHKELEGVTSCVSESCDWLFDKNQPNLQRSKSTSESWNDPVTAAKRKERTGCEVNGTQYRSVLNAFQELGLNLVKHIAFRMELKKSGSADYVENEKTYNFKVVALTKPEKVSKVKAEKPPKVEKPKKAKKGETAEPAAEPEAA